MSEEINNEQPAEADIEPVKKKKFGRGIYDKADVPIRLLDGFIAFIIFVIILLAAIFALNGGYSISFDTQEGTAIPVQKHKYGELVEEPEIPIRPGYIFAGWYYEQDSSVNWDFKVNKVGGDMTLIARWQEAPVTVKFDAAGGTLTEGQESMQVIYQQTYGTLPVPVREGYTFSGWIYSGAEITKDSIVMMPGEHVLSAQWKE